MSVAIGAAGGGGGRRRRSKRRAPMADINMTPFIDVILVLLIMTNVISRWIGPLVNISLKAVYSLIGLPL